MLVAGAQLDDGAGDLVAEHGGQGEGDGAADDVQVGVAQAAGGDLDEHLAGLGAGRAQGLHLKAPVVVAQHGGAHGLGDRRTGSDCFVAGHVAVTLWRGSRRWTSTADRASLTQPDLFVLTNCPHIRARGSRAGGADPQREAERGGPHPPFAEIGSLPHRDRSSSGSRSVHFRTEIGSRRPPGATAPRAAIILCALSLTAEDGEPRASDDGRHASEGLSQQRLDFAVHAREQWGGAHIRAAVRRSESIGASRRIHP